MLERGHDAAFASSLAGFGAAGFLPEHLEHPVGDDVAADDVHRREGHGNAATGAG